MKLKIVALAAAMSIASAAPAATYLITYTGTVWQGYSNGVFGTFDLTGLSYKAIYTWVYPKPGASVLFDGNERQTFGLGATNPLTGVLTINGTQYSFNQGGVVYQYNATSSNPGFRDTLAHIATNQSGPDGEGNYLDHQISSASLDFLPTSSFLTSLNYVPQPGDYALGQFAIYTEGGASAFGNLTFATATIAQVVPEPAAWAMMIAGFGLVGGMLRYKKNAVKARA